MIRRLGIVSVIVLLATGGVSQEPKPEPASDLSEVAALPRVINFSGVLTEAEGKPLNGRVDITFSLYEDAQGGSPLWTETQTVQPDRAGHYGVVLGSATADGLPLEVFSSGAARWLGVQAAGQEEQPRALLVAVPYALKAGDAETIGGLPPTAFLRAGARPSQTNSPQAGSGKSSANPYVTGKGAIGYIPFWNTASDISISALFEKSGNIGLGTTAPVAKLDVNGKTDLRDTLTLIPSKTDPALAISGTPFRIDHTGKITFADGQSFPGGGSGGGVSSVGLSAPASDFTVSGSPVTGSGTLNLQWTKPPTSARIPGAIVKRDQLGAISATTISATNFFADGSVEAKSIAAGTLTSNGATTLIGPVGIGSTLGPEAMVNINVGGGANKDTLLIGDGSKGLQLRDTGVGVDVESLNTFLCLNCSSAEAITFGSYMGFGLADPQAPINLNYLGQTNSDALLIGNNTTKGLQLRDTGTNVDLESIGVPLDVNFVTQQPIYLNPNGGFVDIGIPTPAGVGECGPNYSHCINIPGLLNVGAVNNGSGDYTSAYFSNDVVVSGNFLAQGVKNFRIDHPLDPANKYLDHASIESSEVLNQYSGNAVLDEKGEARVEFPEWFGAINTDFRYQLTAVGAPGPNLYIADEITDRSLRIAGGKPGMKVSWQVTARRNDPYMREHPMVVEQEKPEKLRGHYMSPELYGAPEDLAMFPRPKASSPSSGETRNPGKLPPLPPLRLIKNR